MWSEIFFILSIGVCSYAIYHYCLIKNNLKKPCCDLEDEFDDI